MVENILDGSAVAKSIREDIKKEVSTFKEKPGLAVVLVGSNAASQVYVRIKEKACEEVGFYSEKIELPEDIGEEELLQKIDDLNHNKKINGILVQLPLPRHIDKNKVLKRVSPYKDVDGFHPFNLGKTMLLEESLSACTAKGVVRLLEDTGVTIEGKEVVIVNHSITVGKPLAIMLLNRNATVTVCHSKTKDLRFHTRRADILISATGIRNFITENMVREGAVLVDVGIGKHEGRLHGDFDFENLKKKAGLITPVPGGTGPMTVAVLLKNTLNAFKQQKLTGKTEIFLKVE